jgi:hypothetical protein
MPYDKSQAFLHVALPDCADYTASENEKPGIRWGIFDWNLGKAQPENRELPF